MKTINVSDIDIYEIQDPKLQLLLICLFTDGSLNADELPEFITENRGWWGDSIKTGVNGRKESLVWGSGLWIYDRTKITDDLLIDFKEKIKASLRVAVEAGIIDEPEIAVSRENDQISFVLTIKGEEPLKFEGF